MKQHLSLSSVLVSLTLILLLLGLIAVYNASVVDAYHTFGNKYHFAFQQAKWIGVGTALLILAARMPLALVQRGASAMLLFSLLLMIVTIIPGIGTHALGARRWLNIGSLTLQPSELTKLSLVIYLSTWLTRPKPLLSFIAILGPILALVMLQPDLGTAIIIASTGLLLYYFAGAPAGQLLFLLLGSALLGLLLILISPYRRDRLLTFLNPTQDPLGSSYHVNQILIALGSGGLTGVGLGRSRQKYQYLPEATTDSIFAVIGEETGFLGSLLLLGLLLGLILIGLKIATQAQDRFRQLLASGITSWFAVQILLNLSAMVALVPLTGIPLPLISYGGSSLITSLLGIGLLLNIVYREHLH